VPQRSRSNTWEKHDHRHRNERHQVQKDRQQNAAHYHRYCNGPLAKTKRLEDLLFGVPEGKRDRIDRGDGQGTPQLMAQQQGTANCGKEQTILKAGERWSEGRKQNLEPGPRHSAPAELSSLVAQRFHGIELRRANRWNQPADHAHNQQHQSGQHHRHHGDAQVDIALP